MVETTAPGILAGKRGLVMGVANNRSIAWGIAQAARRHGAELAFTYQGDALRKRVEPLAKELGGHVVGHCDVTDGATIDAVFEQVKNLWGTIDFVVHCIAFSDKDELTGRYLETSEGNFTKSLPHLLLLLHGGAPAGREADDDGRLAADAHLLRRREVDAALQRHGRGQGRARGLGALSGGGSRPENIRVNAISAGPIKTLAASGIGDFRYILKWNEYNSPLRRTVTIEEVGETAAYLVSDMSRGMTGEILHVDAGYHVVGMKNPEAPDMTLDKEGA
jgi:enoyl-[acyl-carrier protein] reductase I